MGLRLPGPFVDAPGAGSHLPRLSDPKRSRLLVPFTVFSVVDFPQYTDLHRGNQANSYCPAFSRASPWGLWCVSPPVTELWSAVRTWIRFGITASAFLRLTVSTPLSSVAMM